MQWELWKLLTLWVSHYCFNNWRWLNPNLSRMFVSITYFYQQPASCCRLQILEIPSTIPSVAWVNEIHLQIENFTLFQQHKTHTHTHTPSVNFSARVIYVCNYNSNLWILSSLRQHLILILKWARRRWRVRVKLNLLKILKLPIFQPQLSLKWDNLRTSLEPTRKTSCWNKYSISRCHWKIYYRCRIVRKEEKYRRSSGEAITLASVEDNSGTARISTLDDL